MDATSVAEAGEGFVKRRVSTVANAGLPLLARSFHRFASLLLLSVGYGWFFSPPRGALPKGTGAGVRGRQGPRPARRANGKGGSG